MDFWLIVVLALLAIMVPAIVWGVISGKRNTAKTLAAEEQFFRETGYTRPDGPSPAHEILFSKPHSLGAMTYRFKTEVVGDRTISQGGMRLELLAPSRRGFQIVARALAPQSVVATAMKATADALLQSSTRWTARFSGPVPLGVESLDAKYLAFADEPGALAALVQDLELVELLSACPQVDLSVQGSVVAFDDPSRFNWGALMASGMTDGQAHLHLMRILERTAQLAA